MASALMTQLVKCFMRACDAHRSRERKRAGHGPRAGARGSDDRAKITRGRLLRAGAPVARQFREIDRQRVQDDVRRT